MFTVTGKVHGSGRVLGSMYGHICRKLAKGKTPIEIAEALEQPEDVIQELCEKAMEYDEEKIRKDLTKK